MQRGGGGKKGRKPVQQNRCGVQRLRRCSTASEVRAREDGRLPLACGQCIECCGISSKRKKMQLVVRQTAGNDPAPKKSGSSVVARLLPRFQEQQTRRDTGCKPKMYQHGNETNPMRARTCNKLGLTHTTGYMTNFQAWWFSLSKKTANVRERARRSSKTLPSSNARSKSASRRGTRWFSTVAGTYLAERLPEDAPTFKLPTFNPFAILLLSRFCRFQKIKVRKIFRKIVAGDWVTR